MSREPLEIVEEAQEPPLARGSGRSDDSQAMASRLARLERAYAELLHRVRGYERDRLEIKSRLERILARLRRD